MTFRSKPETPKSSQAGDSEKWTTYRDTSGGKRDSFQGFKPAIKPFKHSLKFEDKTCSEAFQPVKITKDGTVTAMKTEIPSIPLILPRIQLEINYVEDEYALQYAESLPFSPDTLAWALQNSFSFEQIKRYLESYKTEEVRGKLNVNIETDTISLAVLFFAVEKNCSKTVRLLLERGALPSARMAPRSVPVLVFAILHAENDLLNTTGVVTTLLGLGASPHDIPKDMWVDYMKAPRAVRDVNHAPELGSNPQWCIPEYRAALARTLNLTQRYFLAKTATLKRPSGRAKQVAAAHKVTALLEAPYHLIGQAPATDMVLSRVFGHIALCADTPLILLYAGPSGHGKTELAKQIGTLMSVDTLVVDCTEMRYETDMFGPKHPYQGSAEGSPLNNYLAQQNGGRSIVFLDEFEKTTGNVRQALLLAFDSGGYRDRRNGKLLDCTRTIWVLATNHGSETIVKFYNQHMKEQPDSVRAAAPLARLDSMLKREFTEEMGAPMTGRFTLVVPFFPFSMPEQAVVAHKFILDCVDTLRKPIDMLTKRLIGHMHLGLQNDGQIAAHLAEVGYEEALGARSLQRVVQQLVQVRVAERYLEGDEEITEGTNNRPLQRYMLRLDAVEEGVSEVVVSRGRSERGRASLGEVVELASRIVYPERFVFGKSEGV